MTRPGFAMLALAIVAIVTIASWAYNVNYRTREALDRLSDLRAEIAGERETLQVLRVEWAYLNRPERLARLVAEHNDRLHLVALMPEAFGQVASVPYPPRPVPLSEPEPEALIASAPVLPGASAGVNALRSDGTKPLPSAERPATADQAASETVALAPVAAVVIPAARPKPARRPAAVVAATPGAAAGQPTVAPSATAGVSNSPPASHTRTLAVSVADAPRAIEAAPRDDRADLRAAIAAALAEAGVAPAPVEQDGTDVQMPVDDRPVRVGSQEPAVRPVAWRQP